MEYRRNGEEDQEVNQNGERDDKVNKERGSEKRSGRR